MRFYAFGEALVDIIVQADGTTFSSAGGSLLNVAVSMARAGASVQLMTDFGHDGPGDRLQAMLETEKVGTAFVSRFSNGKTPLAYAALDDAAKASYTFYKQYPEKRFSNASIPEFSVHDCLAFGSFSSVQDVLQPILSQLIEKAVQQGSLIFYDPNIRQHKLNDDASAMENLMRNFAVADLIRGSDEDFEALFASSDLEAVSKKLSLRAEVPLIITRGGEAVECLHQGKHASFMVPAIQNLISTIGAGDAFDAGLLCILDMQHIGRKELRNLHPDMLGMMIATAVSFATDVCQSPENFISRRMAERYAAFRKSL